MNRIDRFSIETHSGPYESWPPRSRLIADGVPSPLVVNGYVLLRQFETPAGYLLVTDYDCPFEEAVNFMLISKDLRKILSMQTVGAAYSTALLEDIVWTDALNFTATFMGIESRWAFSIRSWSIPVLFPRLKMRRVPQHRA